MILINAFAIGIETDSRDPYGTDIFWDIVEYVFLFIFTVEMMLRMVRYKFKSAASLHICPTLSSSIRISM